MPSNRFPGSHGPQVRRIDARTRQQIFSGIFDTSSQANLWAVRNVDRDKRGTEESSSRFPLSDDLGKNYCFRDGFRSSTK
jgi:hypothetical protein